MNPIERIMRRRQVQAFIAADPVDVAFRRPTEKIRTPAGGWVNGTPAVLSPQRGRIIPAKRRYASPLVNTEQGEIIDLEYILLGAHNMDVQPGDSFTWEGQAYEVKSINPDREERTVCAIDFYGPTP